jgi:hypothetical protein
MAKNTFADLDVTPANNTDLLNSNSTGAADANTIDTLIQNFAGMTARFYGDIGGLGTVGGSANTITLTSLSTYQALKSGLVLGFKASAANTGAATLNLDGIAAKAIRRPGDVALTGGEIAANGRYLLIYDAAYNTAAGAWVLLNAEPKGISGLTTTDNAVLRADGTAGRAQDSALLVDDTGNITSFGGQVAFPATANPSADANTLDDYEEGTFTPTMTFGGSSTGVTYNSQTGRYTKIGRFVFFNLSIGLTNNGSGSGAAVVTGLPFAAAVGLVSVPVSLYCQSGFSSLSSPVAKVDAGTSSVYLLNVGATGGVDLTDSNLGNSATFQISGCYTV